MGKTTVLLIDNYDSFVYNIARYLMLLGCECHVMRNDALTVEEAVNWPGMTHCLISPGPCGPDDAGICCDLVSALYQRIPILGICLGHQVIGRVFGGSIVRAKQAMHGRSSLIMHDGTGVFSGLGSPLSVGRYHSLIVELPDQTECRVTARSAQGEVMGLVHRHCPTYGIQFHPESVLTQSGICMIENFIKSG